MDITLSISLLASNRRGSLERCLDSLKPLLVKIPCELIIVFTGTDQEVKKIAEKYTPQVIPFQWCNDFSAARNAGLKEANGEWFLYLDDDEWFEDAEEICDFFLSGEYRNYNCAHYIQRNYQDWEGRTCSDFSAFRMVRRFPGTQFQNAIHEELVPRKEPCKFFQKCIVHHYGYIKEKAVNRDRGKTARNISLLEQAVREQPAFVKNYLQLTKEYDLEGNWKTAEKYCREGRSICQRSGDPASKGWLQAYLAHLLCNKPGKRQVIAELEGIIEREHPSELILLVLYQNLIHLYRDEKECEKVIDFGIRFKQLLSDMDAKTELWKEQGYGEFDESYVKNPERLYPVIADCTACALEMGMQEQASYFIECFPWKEEDILCRYYPAFEEWRAKYGSAFMSIVSHILDIGKSLEVLDETSDDLKALDNAYETDSFSAPVPADISTASAVKAPVYLLFIKALELLNNGQKREGSCLYIRCMERSENPYLQQVMLREALLNRISISHLAARMSLFTWNTCTDEAVKDMPYALAAPLLDSAEELHENYPLYGLCLKKYALNLQLQKGFFMWDELTGTLENYCQCILTFYKVLYKSNLFEESSLLFLPDECRFSITALDALEQMGIGNPAEAVRLFRTCIKIFPSMTGVLKELLRQAVRRINDPALHAGSEFGRLAVQMKGTLSMLLGTGQTMQATGILEQLLPLMPEDTELIRMRQELIRRTQL